MSRRVVFVVPWLEVGGADRFNLDLIDQLTRHGWTSTIITTLTSDHPWHDEFHRLTPDIVHLAQRSTPAKAPGLVSDVLRDRDPSVVFVSQSEAGYLLLPSMQAAVPDAAFIDLCHSAAADWMDGGYPRYSVEAARFIDLTVVTSHQLKAWMVERGASPAAIEVCYTNVDADSWKPDAVARTAVRAEIGVGDDRSMVLYVGRLSDEKRPLLVLRILELVATAHNVPFCVIAGDGPLRPEVEAHLAESSRLRDAARLEGSASPDRVRQLMAASDLFLLPSSYEGIALTVFEAMATGVCVVASDVGGQRELVTPDRGVLIATGDGELDRFASAVRDLIADPARRRSMGAAARDAIVTSFRLDDMGLRMNALFEKALRHRKRRMISDEDARTSARATTWYLKLAWARSDRPRVLRLVWKSYALLERRGWRWPGRLARAVRRVITRW